VVVLPALPLNPNGKVDRHALPAPAWHDAIHEPPQGEVEEALAAIWAEVLGVPRIGRDDNFFALGGHSLAALQVQALVQQSLSVRLPLKRYFERPSLQGLAAALAQERQRALADDEAGLDEMAALLESLES
jgi:acyl carrier protein